MRLLFSTAKLLLFPQKAHKHITEIYTIFTESAPDCEPSAGMILFSIFRGCPLSEGFFAGQRGEAGHGMFIFVSRFIDSFLLPGERRRAVPSAVAETPSSFEFVIILSRLAAKNDK